MNSVQKPFFYPIQNGAIEALKWLALICMTLDHINKYLLHDSIHILFFIGRLALPLFSFVLAFNLARSESLARGVYPRTLIRLATIGVISSFPFIALGGVAWGWWPVNIMMMLFASTSVIYFIEKNKSYYYVLAFLIFIVGGCFVEFWWPGLATCVTAWVYCKRPTWSMLIIWIGAVASLYFINQNLWALAAFPTIFLASLTIRHLPRIRWIFYLYYPVHLIIILLVKYLFR
jgi:hypothetical protein